jgi:hypothetical protein
MADSAPQRRIREADLLYWAQKILGLEALPSLGAFCDGVLTIKILQRVLSGEPQTTRALQLALHEPAASLSQRLDNLALVDAVLRENGSPGVFGSAQSAGDDVVDIAQVESGQEAAVANLLLVLYRFYCTKSTSEVRRVKVRAKSAKLPGGSATRSAGGNAGSTVVETNSAEVRVARQGGGGGGWEGWKEGRLVGLVSVEQALEVRPEEYQDKLAALAAHACWVLGLVSFRAPDVASCAGGEEVLRQVKMRDAGTADGAGSCPAWQRGDWGVGGIWDENGWFRRMCRSGCLYMVLLHLFSVNVGDVDSGSREGPAHEDGREDDDACLQRLSKVCEAIKGSGIRLRVS